MRIKDYFIHPDLCLWQDDEQFRFNTDTRLLAEFVQVRKMDRILDIGTNNGVLLRYFDQFTNQGMVGIDVNEHAIELAKLNASFFKQPVFFHQCALQRYQDEPFSLIVTNPPYFPLTHCHPQTKMTARQLGRIEIHLTLAELIEHSARLIQSNGRFCMVHRPERWNDINACLQRYHFGIKRVQLAYTKNGRASSLCIEAYKDRKPQVEFLAPVMV